jgi:hypothetical protein
MPEIALIPRCGASEGYDGIFADPKLMVVRVAPASGTLEILIDRD